MTTKTSNLKSNTPFGFIAINDEYEKIIKTQVEEVFLKMKNENFNEEDFRSIMINISGIIDFGKLVQCVIYSEIFKKK